VDRSRGADQSRHPGGSPPGSPRRRTVPIKRGDEQIEIGLDDIPMTSTPWGGVIIMDDSRSMSWVLNNINAFYAHESCGQCTPCREGSLWMEDHEPHG
jgi:NADH:ubiquinone oxidoreductase subunit F (NADH-binding)